MKKLLDIVIPKKTNKKKLIVETNHILEKISNSGIDEIIKEDEKENQKPQ